MIFILVILLIIILYISFIVNQNRFFSVTVISTASFLISAIVYCVGYSMIGKDISLKLILVVIASLIFMLIGEVFGRKIRIKKKYNIISKDTILDPNCYDASKIKMGCVFLLMLLVFLVRFVDLYKFSLTLGNERGIINVINSVRLAYATGQYKSNGIIMQIAIYTTLIAEIYAYAYLYFFLYNAIIENAVKKHLLLPILGYMIIIISFTGRTEYIKCIAMFIWMTLFLYYKKGISKRRTNRLLLRRICKVGIVAVILLFMYGTLTRGSEGSNWLGSIVAYIGSPLYGLDNYMDKLLYDIAGQEKAFGYYTLQNIHAFLNRFGNNYEIPLFHHLPFFYYKYGSSNIYTCLLYPILDYGITGMFFTRFLLGFFIGILEKSASELNIQNIKSIGLIIFMGIIYYNAMNSYIADRYYDSILSPSTLFKYTIFTTIVITLFCGGITFKFRKVEI